MWVVSGAFLLVAGALHLERLSRWAGDRTFRDRTFRDRLVLALHVGYSFVPVGFLLTGIASFVQICSR